MIKRLLFVVLFAAFALAGCSSGPDYQVKFTKDMYFQTDKSIPFEIKVTENNKAVKGLKITAEFLMNSMDHDSSAVKLTETDTGVYTGKADLSMSGKYEVDLTLEKGGKKIDKVVNVEVKKPKGVAAINGQWITKEDLAFYKLINQLQLAMNRETAQKKYSGKQLDEELSYLDSQEKMTEDKNQLLTQIIRLRSVALLAEEKGHKADAAEVAAEVNKVRAQYDQYASAKQLIISYGEDKFWKTEQEQYKMIVLSKKVQQDMLAQVKKENPQSGAQELAYLAEEKYEELLVSQVNSLDIVIL